MTKTKPVLALLQAVTALTLLLFASVALAGWVAFLPAINADPIRLFVLALEALAYSVLLLALLPGLDLLAALSSVGLALLMRVVFCLASGLIVWTVTSTLDISSPGETLPDSALAIGLNLWLGQPLPIAVHLILTGITTLSVMLALKPSLTNRWGAEKTARAAFLHSQASKPSANAPVGGYIHLYSYQQLHDFVRKVPGMMGFALATDEGLVVTGEGGQLPFPLESAVPRLQIGTSLLKAYQRRSGMPVDELWQFSDQYTLIMVSLEPCFFLIVFVRPDTDMSDLKPRITAVRRSAETFLVERHGEMTSKRQAEAAA